MGEKTDGFEADSYRRARNRGGRPLLRRCPWAGVDSCSGGVIDALGTAGALIHLVQFISFHLDCLLDFDFFLPLFLSNTHSLYFIMASLQLPSRSRSRNPVPSTKAVILVSAAMIPRSHSC